MGFNNDVQVYFLRNLINNCWELYFRSNFKEIALNIFIFLLFVLYLFHFLLGSINVVDIRKLLDPEVASKNCDSSIIILSDTDSEIKNKSKEKQPVRYVTRIKKQVSFHLPTSESSDGEAEIVKKSSRKSGEDRKVRRNQKKQRNLSESDSDSCTLNTKSRKGKSQKANKPKEPEIVCTKEVVIRLPRVPCEKLKEYYSGDKTKSMRLVN